MKKIKGVIVLCVVLVSLAGISLLGAISVLLEFPICTDPDNQWSPAISGNTVVWRGDRNGNVDIYGAVLGEEVAINPIAAFMPVKNYHLRQVNSCLGCIEESLPDDVPQDIQDLLDEMQEHIDNANTTGNSIYANNELLKALDCCEDIQEHLGITCDL
jgi:beta propeller repeat protein